jgi:hypothetical protein
VIGINLSRVLRMGFGCACIRFSIIACNLTVTGWRSEHACCSVGRFCPGYLSSWLTQLRRFLRSACLSVIKICNGNTAEAELQLRIHGDCTIALHPFDTYLPGEKTQAWRWIVGQRCQDPYIRMIMGGIAIKLIHHKQTAKTLDIRRHIHLYTDLHCSLLLFPIQT